MNPEKENGEVEEDEDGGSDRKKQKNSHRSVLFLNHNRHELRQLTHCDPDVQCSPQDHHTCSDSRVSLSPHTLVARGLIH
jgi:hypothetical protein